MDSSKKRILILGSFDDGNNIGDTAILSALISDFTEELSNVEFIVPVRRRRALQPYPVRTIWSRILLFDPCTIAAVTRSDLILMSQGNIFDSRLFDITFNRLFGYAYLCTLAKWLGKRIAFYNAGLGPVTTDLGDRLARYVVQKADLITLRESQSLEYLEKWEIESPHWVAADAALNTRVVGDARRELVWKHEGIDAARMNVAFNVTGYIERTFASDRTGLTQSQFVRIIAQVADLVVQKLDGQIFFVATSRSDEGIHRKIIQAMEFHNRARLIVPMLQYTPEELVAIFSGMNMVIGSRMHSLILSASAGTALIGLVYSPKTRNFMENIGQRDRTIELRDLSSDYLFSLIEQTSQHREEITEAMTSILAPMKKRARASAKLVADLIR